MRNYTITLLAAWLLPICLAAQVRWEMGLFGGASGYLGDLNPKQYPILAEIQPAMGLSLSRYLTPSFSLKFSGIAGQISGDDQNFPVSGGHRDRNFAFLTRYYGGDLRLVWDPFGKSHYPEVKYRYKARTTPYFFAGYGLMQFDPKPDYRLFDRALEEIPQKVYDDQRATQASQLPNIPFGGGLRFDFNRKTSLAFEGTLRYLNSDMLDGVSLSGKPNNNDWVINAGANLLIRLGQSDSDGDGFVDKIDKCPRLKGVQSAWGCPDEDEDGVEDAEDACLGMKGTIATAGCPDADGDGFMDSADKCPKDYGFPETEGCPDRDNDCFPDATDPCPDLAGPIAYGGCPDSDLDSIPDHLDACPDKLGLAEYKGCPEPDTDGDGIIDKKDRCPEIADTTNVYGCPDTDRDSLIDLDDRCPDLAGTLANKGCPDTDGDSLVDLDDRCPTLPGKPEQAGCPDQDGDGVVDIDDPCPEVGGVEKMRGCPEIKKEDVAILLKAQKQVRFKTGSAILLPESKKILDQVVALMGRYPEYFLSIAGHTDSQGKDDFNLTLSKKRAKACVDYLLAKKVATERMVHDGFGETKPIADNATAAGRLQNRRVEFVLDVKALK